MNSLIFCSSCGELMLLRFRLLHIWTMTSSFSFWFLLPISNSFPFFLLAEEMESIESYLVILKIGLATQHPSVLCPSCFHRIETLAFCLCFWLLSIIRFTPAAVFLPGFIVSSFLCDRKLYLFGVGLWGPEAVPPMCRIAKEGGLSMWVICRSTFFLYKITLKFTCL